MSTMNTPIDIVMKIARHGPDSLTYAERIFVVDIFRVAAMTNRPEALKIKHRIQQAYLEYCLSLNKKGGEYD